jgi:leader peptidase (prepilin peptidase)/N-methyltransferase
MTAESVIRVWLILVGPCLGSFLAAFAERTCRGASVVHGRSMCASCGVGIAPRDLVPVLSYLALRGRCRRCGASIPRELLVAEIAGGALSILAILRGETLLEEIAGSVFLWVLMGLFLCDRACFRLPDALTIVLLASGLVIGSASAAGWWYAVFGAAIGPGVFWILGAAYLRLRGRAGLGFGDVKMMAGIGAAVGPLSIAWVTLLASSIALVDTAVRAGGVQRLNRARRIAFGCFLALAGGAVWLAGGGSLSLAR